MSRKIKTLALPPASYDTTAAAMYLAQQLKAAGRADVAALLVKNELNARLEKKAKRRRKTVLYTERGEKIELFRDIVEGLEATE